MRKSSRRKIIQATTITLVTLLGPQWAMSQSIVGSFYSKGESNMSHQQRGYAPGPYGQIHYLDTGGDGRPLVLLHQSPMTLRQYDSVYGLFAERGFRAIGIDTPGYGQSDPPSFIPKIEDYAPATVAVLDHLGIAKVDLIGHHTGALIATEVAIQFPERINNLVMHAPLPLDDEQRAFYMKYTEDTEVNLNPRANGEHLAELFRSRNSWSHGEINPAIVTRYIAEALIGYGPFWWGHNAAFKYDHAASLPKLSHRTLVIINTGDAIYPNAQVAMQMRPDFEYSELAGGGGDIVDQQSEPWVNAIIAFLNG